MATKLFYTNQLFTRTRNEGVYLRVRGHVFTGFMGSECSNAKFYAPFFRGTLSSSLKKVSNNEQ